MSGTLHVQNLGKSYRQWGNEWRRVASWFAPSIRPREEHWVLKDVSFSVSPGEAVGIVGQNGAGKSTLLKLITGTTQPTQGQVQLSGRIAAILELGMGFNPDLTGRQNAYHSAGLMGHGQAEIERIIPDIEEFAEVGEYFDQPVRTYSSGMQMRVAFAVATAFRPDILIVDEALSVGDAAFQRKCFRRIETFRAQGGTLLFVSHDIETVKKLCDRALFIKEGRLAHFGMAKPVCDEYEKYLFGGRPKRAKSASGVTLAPATESSKFDPSLVASCEMSYGNGKAKIFGVSIEDECGNKVNTIQTGVRFHFVFDVLILDSGIYKPFANMQIKTTDGVVIYGVNSNHLNLGDIPVIPGRVIRVHFSLENHLAPGVYFFTCGFKEKNSGGEAFCSRLVDAFILKVTDRSNSTVAQGILDMGANLEIFMIEDSK